MLYLAIAHYGRGRGDWVEGEAPAHWKPLVEEIVRARQGALEAVWRTADEEPSADGLAARLEPELAAAARDLLVRLYPEARALF